MASHEIIREPRIVLTLELDETELLVKILHTYCPASTQEGDKWTALLNDIEEALFEIETGSTERP